MEYLFLLADLKQRAVLVIGGGDIAARKISILKRAGAKVKVVAHELCSELQEMERMHDLVWIGKIFESSMLDDVFLVIIAARDQGVNDYICRDAEKRYKFVNVVDDQSKCSLLFPSIIDCSPIMVAISSCGKAPALVRMLREKLESLLPNFLGSMANLIGIWQTQVKNCIKDTVNRRRFWERVLHNQTFHALIAQGACRRAEKFVLNFLNNCHGFLKKPIGSVALVGAGPGDSGLFTLRGLQFVQEADIILYDYLVTPEILDLVRRDAKKIYVGKQGGFEKTSMKQSDINNLLIRFARKGNRVVRLKGGDPFIFGRGGEELEEVLQAGIPCQVVPGVTAASSVTIYAGIPLTHRDYANSVIFITGRFFSQSYNSCNFRFLSCQHQTLVIYMGSVNVSKICMVLIDNGYDIKTLVAVVSGGTSRKQKILIGVLDDLEDLVDNSFSPSLLIIGKVVDLHHKMHWFNQEDMQKYEFGSLINLF